MVVEGVGPHPETKQPRWRDRWAQLVSRCPDAFVEVDTFGTVIEWNPRAEALFGWTRDQVVGRPVIETLSPPELGLSPFSEASGPPGSGRDHRWLSLMHRTGHRVVADGVVFDIGHGSRRSIAGFLRPRTLALHGVRPAEPFVGGDTVTGLPDRVHFSHQLAEATARAQGKPGTVAVVLLDVDRFKAVNNSMGHDAGDLVLASVAQRLLQAAGAGVTVAHFGGDEFLAMFLDPSGEAYAAAAAFIERSRMALIAPFDAGGIEVFLDVSAGVALNAFGVDDAATLLSNAEAAMYRAKRRGGSSVETFGESMRIELLDRMSTEHSLHRALERSELMLHYQPVVEIAGVTTVGVEALIRWDHPDQGLVSPYRFIPVAEESGLIIPIGAWVLEQACHQLRDWHHQGHTGPQGSVEVNLSARQIDDSRIVRTVEEILTRTGLPAEYLTLEITESALMQDAASALDILRALKEIGVQLAIDDFGTGYSSLSYLQRFPLDVLKIDQSFVETLGVDAGGDEIVSAVIDLAHALGLQVVAEGVETTGQLQILRALGCDLAQGFLFSRPLPAADLGSAFGLPMSA
jgi:diguanylate cyclase (GGDEF)-like protein/PAS domain S-box-containing protein